MDFDEAQIEQMVEKNVKSVLGNKYKEESETFLNKIDEVNAMLNGLISKDKDEVIISFLKNKFL